MNLGLFNTIVSVTAIFISITTFVYLQRRQRLEARWSRTLDLHDRLNSQAFSRARRLAAQFVRDHPTVDWQHADLNALSDRIDQIESLYEVMRFYHRLRILLKSGWLVEDQVFALFGEGLAWWEGLIFERMRGRPGWRTGKDIEQLVGWMGSRASGEWESLVEIGRNARQPEWRKSAQALHDRPSAQPA